MVGTKEEPGLMVRAIDEIFNLVKSQTSPKVQFEVVFSFFEIYNEQIRDLLEPNNKGLNVREDSEEGVVVSNISKHKPQNVDQVFDMLAQGNLQRACSPTAMNDVSSRSHAVLQLSVKRVEKQTGGGRAGKFFGTLLYLLFSYSISLNLGEKRYYSEIWETSAD